WLVGMLDAPGQPTMDVAINVVVMRGQHLEDMFAEVRPLAELGLDAEPAPQIEAVIDDGFAPRREDHAVILSAFNVGEPPLSDADRLLTDNDVAIEIEIAEIRKGQELRRPIGVAVTVEFMLLFSEPQHHGLAAVAHHGIVAV